MRRNKRVDRRRFVRREFKVKKFVTAWFHDSDAKEREVSLAILDISEGGLRVKVEGDLPKGEFNLHLDLTGLEDGFQGRLVVPCETAWKRLVTGVTWVHGLEFVTPPETSELLTRVLTELTGAEV